MSGTSDLPGGWARVSLETIAANSPHSITDGPFGSNLKTEHYTASGPRVIRLQNIGAGRFVDEVTHISEEHFCRLQKHEIRAGDLAIALLGEQLPRACVIPEQVGPAIVKADCARFQPDADLVSTAFLNYWLNYAQTQRDARTKVKGVGRPRMNLSQLKQIPVLLPPRREQGRIVAKVEELFSDLDAGVAALERVRVNLKRYRAAVLKAAVEGRLTESWRQAHPSAEPASKLLERILAERRQKWEQDQLAKYAAAGKPPPKDWREKYPELAAANDKNLHDLPVGWNWATVQQVGEVKLGRQRSPEHHTGKHMRPYLRVANVFDDRLDLSDVMEMNFTPAEFETYALRYGDILLNEGQSLELVGRAAMYRNGVPGLCFQNTLVRFRASDGVLPEFALIVFRAYLYTQRFQKIARWTVNIAHLGADRFANLEFPLPPIQEQHQIVAEVGSRLSVADAAGAQLHHERIRTSRLRQGILRQAFDGKLVPQDPTDEPAALLVERIQAERARNASGSNGKKKNSRPKLNRPIPSGHLFAE